ncbi:TIGR04222 domain-containing membrane protein [Saccharothrix isguenensis]
MANTWTPTTAGSAGSTPDPRDGRAGSAHGGLGPEEQAFLVGGPGRAAEVAVVSLAEAGALRISRDGLVTPVQSNSLPRTSLQARALHSLPRPLGALVTATAGSPETVELRQHLINQGLVVPAGRRRVARTLRRVVVLAAVLAVFATIALDLPFGVAGGAVVGALALSVVLTRARRPLTGSGRAVVRQLRQAAASAASAVGPQGRVAMVAYYGLLGRVGRQHVWKLLGIAPAAAATLRRRSRGQGSAAGASCGGGCGSCSSSSCGGAASSDNGGSSGSDSGSSGSDSGGSSCGGGGGD